MASEVVLRGARLMPSVATRGIWSLGWSVTRAPMAAVNVGGYRLGNVLRIITRPSKKWTKRDSIDDEIIAFEGV